MWEDQEEGKGRGGPDLVSQIYSQTVLDFVGIFWVTTTSKRATNALLARVSGTIPDAAISDSTAAL
jgi:hypothetical protein